MIPKLSRLTQDKDFSRVYKSGQRVSGQILRILILGTNQNATRFGFVISKKDLAHSSSRNRVKRILRAAVRSCLKKIKTGQDVIIQARPGVKNARPADLRAELAKLLSRAKLIT